MTKFGEPPSPSELAEIPPDVRVLEAGATLWRLYFRGGPHPTIWSAFRSVGPTSARFDHQPPLRPLPKRRIILKDAVPTRREILYAALDGLTCLAEVFQESRTINRAHNEPWLVAFDLAQPLQLLDLTGLWPTRTGRASNAINSGPRSRARRWSQAIYEAYPELHGLYYASSMNAGKPCVALYERARALGITPPSPRLNRALIDPTWLVALRNAAAELGYALV